VTVVDVEIAVQDLAGVLTARDAGADRVELCVALVTGGLTPPAGLLEAAVGTGLPVHPLVRTRTGGFVHDPLELDVLVRDVRAAVRGGAAGVVVGALRADGTVDEDALRALVDAADGAPVTFHRAFDVVPDRRHALDRLAALGVTRLLTSAGAPTAPAGTAGLADLVRHARTAGVPVQVMAGGGVRPADVPALVAAGVDAVHLSARRPGHDRGRAGPGGGATGFEVTDADVVRRAVAAVAATRGR
jgi:copper homeostasis protein